MSNEQSNLRKYFTALSQADKRALERRLETHRDRLQDLGYELAIAEGEHGFFAGVLVIDDENDRFGFLEDDGSITWLTGENQGIGALGKAIAQNPTDELVQDADGLENVDIE